MTDHLALVEGFVTVNIGMILPVHVMRLVEWDTTVDVLHAPFGYLPPRFEDGEFAMSVRICPELIASHVAHLDDGEDVMDYLLIIEQHIAQHVIHYESRPDDELEVFIAMITEACGPTMYRQGKAIQMRVLGG